MVEQSTTDGRYFAALAANAVFPVQDLLHVLAGRDDGEQHVDVFQIGQVVDHFAADLVQRFGFGAGAVPDGHVIASLDQPLGHGNAHAAGADPANLLLLSFRSPPLQLPSKFWIRPCLSTGRKRASERWRLADGRQLCIS